MEMVGSPAAGMYTVGRRMLVELRETALGYAATPAACAVCGRCG